MAELPELTLASLFALLAGGIVLNVLKEELPEERDSRFWACGLGGFCSLAPELVAPLVAKDGAGLRWLGAANATKDFMHFELRADDQPPLY